jgi:hypothetical protein
LIQTFLAMYARGTRMVSFRRGSYFLVFGDLMS